MKPLPFFLSTLTLMVAAMGLTAPAQAQSDDWDVVIAPYVLFGSLNGDAAIGRTDPTPVDLGFGDLVKNLQFGAMVHTEVRKGAWGGMVDLLYMKLGSDLSGPLGGVVDIEVEELVVEAFLSRRFGLSSGSVDVYGGIRYWDLSLIVALEGVLRGAPFLAPLLYTNMGLLGLVALLDPGEH